MGVVQLPAVTQICIALRLYDTFTDILLVYVFAGYKSSEYLNGAKVRQFLKLASKKRKNFHLGVKVFCKGLIFRGVIKLANLAMYGVILLYL